MKRKIVIISTLLIATIISIGALGNVAAKENGNGPNTSDMFLCPSVSTNNPNAMWVIGGSGAYYVNFPGISSPNWVGMMETMEPMEVTNLNPFGAIEDKTGTQLPNGKDFPSDVEGQAQVKAYKGLYNKLDGVPDGTIAMVLPDDGTGYLFDDFGLSVTAGLYKIYPQSNGAEVDTGDYPKTMMGMTIMGEIYADIPLKSAAFW